MIPTATYRLQLHAGFTFADAEAVVPYLAELGVSHLYASPITAAARGSTHGYDVVDPTRINPELGGEQGLLSLVAALKRHGLGLIIDIVPNHMGVAGDENAWWLDVLEHGQASEYAPVFDIDWRERVALPVLGTPLREALADGAIQLVPRGERLAVQLYGGAIYPIREDDPIHKADRSAAFSPDQIAEVLDRQHYRLVYWRAANDELNWRRFFSINELAGVRIEDPAVFERTHALYFDLFRRGLIDGVRVDHVDGLADPAGYCRTLRARFDAIAPDRPAYIVVEKILAGDEPFATDWRIEGTSGYDFMRQVSEVLHDPAGQAPLGQLWEEISGRSATFEEEAVPARQDLLAWQFEGQLVACVKSFHALAQAGVSHTWITRGMLRRAIERLLWVFPVYRTYATGQGAPDYDAPIRAAAREAAVPLMPPGEVPVLDAVLGWLAGEGGEGAAEAVRQFQQLSAPIAAKGVEDTAFYRHGALLSANDVGFEPGHFACDLGQFHREMRERAMRTPRAMLATATHDHKRGEDARARLAVLSAVPDAWSQRVRRWLALAAEHAPAVDAGDAYLLFQTLVGASQEGDDSLLERVHDWQRKALREAKLRSSWEAPDEEYEARCHDLATLLLTREDGADFRQDFVAFMEALAAPALANTLAQAALHFLVPGVPDTYQGCELFDLSMVDPDNRRPVDYQRRRRLLAADDDQGEAAKLRLVARLLEARKGSGALREGGYEPLDAVGERAEHVVAFSRAHQGETVLCAVAVRLGAALFGDVEPVPSADWWGDTRIEAQGRTWHARDLFAKSPVAVR
ncbi:(1-_4)-alpha-D-glucan 1-alpha-D-glucosylmutase [Novosphingobium chloroacetimidivorans]|uniref:(1->4)-alpha-D-glucan 1-alpha-D-glucosylmutase n=1 Tax=Novosphingobium chloroacetimidivorans TaxID=1428314 RepID=A0A7W7K871_9SPHN|nr:malto-oligosyltrehalose synthase [Novosphingobium chloroacetimidivorans]MBB4857686.1 (1->4)-alpha-D-glucan 1-alpha-D-glucosylmutase [Novosphingobium chloroacetimidivorans]